MISGIYSKELCNSKSAEAFIDRRTRIEGETIKSEIRPRDALSMPWKADFKIEKSPTGDSLKGIDITLRKKYSIPCMNFKDYSPEAIKKTFDRDLVVSFDLQENKSNQSDSRFVMSGRLEGCLESIGDGAAPETLLYYTKNGKSGSEERVERALFSWKQGSSKNMVVSHREAYYDNGALTKKELRSKEIDLYQNYIEISLDQNTGEIKLRHFFPETHWEGNDWIICQEHFFMRDPKEKNKIVFRQQEKNYRIDFITKEGNILFDDLHDISSVVEKGYSAGGGAQHKRDAVAEEIKSGGERVIDPKFRGIIKEKIERYFQKYVKVEKGKQTSPRLTG